MMMMFGNLCSRQNFESNLVLLNFSIESDLFGSYRYPTHKRCLEQNKFDKSNCGWFSS